jgi:hypothetical protein
MAYPQGVATGNAVIRAALALDQVLTDTDDGMVECKWDDAVHFRDAVAAHRAATAAEHEQGPDMDADS